jgi:antitoxin MazE
MTAKAELKVLPWGNSLAVRIPSAVARKAHIVNGQEVTVEAVDGTVVVKPKARLPQLTLAQKLKRFDPALHGGELFADGPVGREIG